MIIVKITYQHRRDFHANMICEFCKYEEKLDCGYDDDFYHMDVIPNQCCPECGKSTISGGGVIQPYKTKYPDGFII